MRFRTKELLVATVHLGNPVILSERGGFLPRESKDLVFCSRAQRKRKIPRLACRFAVLSRRLARDDNRN